MANRLDHWRFRDLIPLDLPAFYKKKRDYFRTAVESSRFKLLPCRGTYFQLLDYHAISDRPDMEMACWLVEQAGVAAIPVSVFYADQQGSDHRILRFCFAKSNATLDQAAERLCGV